MVSPASSDMRLLAGATWPEVQGACTVLVPVGSVEQHGPHLPVETDTVIAEAVARGVAGRLGDAWVAPPVTYAASGEHQGFPGTCSVGIDLLRGVLVELVRSMRLWTTLVVFVNAHGGNLSALTDAVDQLIHEGHDVGWVPCATEGVDLHAGYTETSLMLHLRPHCVRLDRLEPGTTSGLRQLLPALLTEGVRGVSANGVLGDPRGANAEEGKLILAAMIEDACARLLTQASP